MNTSQYASQWRPYCIACLNALASSVCVSAESHAEAERLQAMAQEMARVQDERSRVGKLRGQLETAVKRLEAERAAWEKHKVSDLQLAKPCLTMCFMHWGIGRVLWWEVLF